MSDTREKLCDCLDNIETVSDPLFSIARALHRVGMSELGREIEGIARTIAFEVDGAKNAERKILSERHQEAQGQMGALLNGLVERSRRASEQGEKYGS